MNSSRATEFKVGLFTLAGLAVLIFGIMWGKQQSLNGATERLAIAFPTSGGLIEGDAVTVNGVKHGRVEQIDIDGNSVLVHATLDRGITLKSDATATIMMLELMGGKKIDIRPGVAAAPLDLSAVMQGTTAEDIPGAVAKLGELSGDLTRVLFRADTMLGSINHILADTVFLQAIKHTMITLDATVVLVKNFVARNQDDMQTTLHDLKTLVGDAKDFFQTNRPQFEKLLKNADKTFTSVDHTIAHADSAISSLDGMLNDIKTNNGPAHKLIYDSAFSAQLDSTVANAHRVMQFILDHGVNVNLRIGTRP